MARRRHPGVNGDAPPVSESARGEAHHQDYCGGHGGERSGGPRGSYAAAVNRAGGVAFRGESGSGHGRQEWPSWRT